MLVDILLLGHFALVVAIAVFLILGVIKERIAKSSAITLGAITFFFAILPQLIIKMTGAWQKVEYYLVYGVAIVILLIIGLRVRSNYQNVSNQDAIN